MNTDAPPTDKPTSDGSTTDPCGDCDLGAVETLACTAKRFQKQADVVNESLTKINEYKTRFGTARADYQKARDAVGADVAATKTTLDDLIGQLRCRLDDDREECLEKALKTVVKSIRECAGKPGCCADACDFDKDPGSDTAAALATRIEEYRRKVAKYAACFDQLLTEQTAIATRVAEIKAEVASIAADMAADKPGKDWARLFARALVAHWRLKPNQLWQGHKTVNDYVDCLCTALTCLLKGWEAIAILEGVKAELDCQDDAKDAACLKKQTDVVDEVMRVYVCECPPDDDQPTDGSDGCGCHDHDHHHSPGGEDAAS